MTDLNKRDDDDLLWPSAYVGTPEQLLNCVTEMWRREKRVTVSAVLHAVIETLRALPAVTTYRYAGESEASVYDRKGFPPIDLAALTPTPAADSQPAVSVPPDISLRIRNLLCKAIDDLENDRGVDLIELERLCILAASQPATDLAAIREAALQARIEELLKERDEYKAAAAIWQEDFIQENQRLYVATVKLAIAVEGLHKIAEYTHIGEGGQGVTQNAEARIASAVLAELEGL